MVIVTVLKQLSLDRIPAVADKFDFDVSLRWEPTLFGGDVTVHEGALACKLISMVDMFLDAGYSSCQTLGSSGFAIETEYFNPRSASDANSHQAFRVKTGVTSLSLNQ